VHTSDGNLITVPHLSALAKNNISDIQKRDGERCATNTMLTAAKDVLPNIHRTQAAVSVHSRHPVTPGLQRNGLVCCWMTSFAAYGIRDALQCIVNREENPSGELDL